jgi:hypothetical protein
MAIYTIIGTVTYSSQANRDAARSRLDTALAGITYSNFASNIATGVNNSGTTAITVSISLPDADGAIAGAALNAVLTAFTSSNRHTSGFVGVDYV